MSKRKVLAEEVGVVAFPLPANRIRFNILRITVKLIAGEGNEVMKILLKETERSVWYYIARRWTRRQYSGLKDCRVLEYDTGQQVPGKHLL
jgi:hypothetical protein